MPTSLHPTVRTLGLHFALLCAATLAPPAIAQTVDSPPKAGAMASPALTDGEVRKIDKEANKITIKHGEIKHFDMPPMTMVFVVKDSALLEKTTVGAKIRFMAVYDNGRMTVTEIHPVK